MTEIITLEVRIHEAFLTEIDHWIKRWGFEDHGEFIRNALRSQVRQYEDHDREIHKVGEITNE